MTKLMAGRAIEFGLLKRFGTLKNQVDNRAGVFYTPGGWPHFRKEWLAVNVHGVQKTTEGIC
jgi:hypothetical protein